MDFQQDVTQRILALEQQVDRLKGSSDWDTWTPVITQNVNVTFTTVYAVYFTIGRVVFLMCNLNCTSAGTAANLIKISGVPAAVRPALGVSGTTLVGMMHILNVGVAYYNGALVYAAADDFRGLAHAAGNYIGIIPNFALANGSAVSMLAVYER